MISPFAIYEDRYIKTWQEITRAVHERGTKIAMQIGHLGRQDIPELNKICKYLNPPEEIIKLTNEYNLIFGHLKHIRDSAIHIEDRGRGKTRHEKPLNTSIIVLGSFNGNRFGFTGEDGRQYEIEISEKTVLKAKNIIQEVINSYPWDDNFKMNNGLTNGCT